MIWFTSDLHLFHDKEFIWKERGYLSLKHMHKDLLAYWNTIVEPEDDVYILGDIFFGDDYDNALTLFNLLQGKKHLVFGNHDTMKKIELLRNLPNVEICGYATCITYKWKKIKRTLYLSHYPTDTSNSGDEYWNFVVALHGHTHSKEKFQNGDYHMYNVALDAHCGMPVSIGTILSDVDEMFNLKMSN